MTKLQRLKARLPRKVLLGIVQHLSHLETFRLTLLCRYARELIIYDPEFEGQWVIKSFHGLLSKAGYTGIRNNNLRLIDIQLRNMHFQARSLVHDCREE